MNKNYELFYWFDSKPKKDKRTIEEINEELSLNQLEVLGYNYIESLNLINEIKKDKRLLQRL